MLYWFKRVCKRLGGWIPHRGWIVKNGTDKTGVEAYKCGRWGRFIKILEDDTENFSCTGADRCNVFRPGVKRMSKEEMSSMGDPAKDSEGKLRRWEGKNIYLHLAELRYRNWEESQEDRIERSDWKEGMSLTEEIGLKIKMSSAYRTSWVLEEKKYQLYCWYKLRREKGIEQILGVHWMKHVWGGGMGIENDRLGAI